MGIIKTQDNYELYREDKMKLYYAPKTCSVAIWIALDWLKADYEVERVDLSDEEYKKINPSGAVPALDSGDGKIKTQLGAILSYLLEKYPQEDLGADDNIEDRNLFNQISYFLAADYHTAFSPFFGPNNFTTGESEEDINKIKEAAFKKIDAKATLLNDMMGENGHVYKDKKTVLDAYVYILSRWLRFTPKSWTEYPNINKLMEKMEQDGNVQKIIKESEK